MYIQCMRSVGTSGSLSMFIIGQTFLKKNSGEQYVTHCECIDVRKASLMLHSCSVMFAMHCTCEHSHPSSMTGCFALNCVHRSGPWMVAYYGSVTATTACKQLPRCHSIVCRPWKANDKTQLKTTTIRVSSLLLSHQCLLLTQSWTTIRVHEFGRAD